MYINFRKITVEPRTGRKRKEAIREAREFALNIGMKVTLDYNDVSLEINGKNPKSMRVLDAKLLDLLDNKTTNQ